MNKVRFVIAQLNYLVGDIEGNLNKMIEAAEKARTQYKADLIIFSELALSGYPPEDLLLRSDFNVDIQKALNKIEQIKGIDIIIGYPDYKNNKSFNAALMIVSNKIIANYHKQLLPNYGVFDEKRYFKPGFEPCIIQYKGINLGLLICEDLWFPEPVTKTVQAGAECIICINASPFDIFKLRERERILKNRIAENKIPIIYVHCIGGQDELVFDGRSMVMNEKAEITHLAPIFKEYLLAVDLQKNKELTIIPGDINPRLSDEARTYLALVTATHDYIEKNNFSGALLGLSGGIDSALTLTIAVDAIGAEKVHAVIMPSRYTAAYSIEDAIALAKNMGVRYSIISIESAYTAFLKDLEEEFAGTEVNTAEENIQARCRAIILMALSNKFGKIVLTTGNKSEMAVGYATLYGDMAGGFAVLKDVYKTLVYELVNYRNQIQAVIPQRIIDRPPSAELRLDQTDQDTLPPYAELDEILKFYVEQNCSISDIVAHGFDEDTVKQIINFVDKNEYKRRQAPPGPKITTRAFGRDRRYPITSGYGRGKWKD